MMGETPNILVCRCKHYHKVPEAVWQEIVRRLDAAGVGYGLVDDLCGAAAEDAAAVRRWADRAGLCVAACYPRAVRWLFDRAGAALGDDARVFNAITEDVEAIVGALTAEAGRGGVNPTLQAAREGEWIPWYPVIDYDRCAGCRQCMNFCLFGVFGISDEGRVEVVKPQGCKTNCPACARVCPERAIIFPKYEKSPINGDEVDEAAIDAERERSELETLLGGDVHEIIRQRAARKRFTRKGEGGDALSSQEKAARLSRLQAELDIPQEVLDALGGAAGDCPNAGLCEGDCGKKEGEA